MLRFLSITILITVLIFALISAVIKPLGRSIPLERSTHRATIPSHYSDVSKQQLEKVVLLEKMIQNRQYERALNLAEKLEHSILNNPEIEAPWLVRYFDARADVHFNLWHFIDARRYWEKGFKAATPEGKRYFINKLDHIAKVIDRINGERNQQLFYQAMPGTGPAGALRGKIAVIYVFVQLGNTGSWSLKNREAAFRSWELSSQWLNAWAQKIKDPVVFTHRLFIVGRSFYLSRISVENNMDARNKAGQILRYCMDELSETSVLGFVDRIKKEETADQAILLFHINDNKRSFAHCCIGPCKGQFGEFAFIFELPTAQRQQMLQYTMAHEAMHLFGADDLYNINNAKEYIPRDVMNYPSRLLSTSTIEGISAYAVGLLDVKPQTPFPVTEN